MQRNNLTLQLRFATCSTSSQSLSTICGSTANYARGTPPSEARAAMRPKPRQPRPRGRPAAPVGYGSPSSTSAPTALPQCTEPLPGARGSGHPPANTRTRPPTGFRGAHPFTGSSAGLIGRDKREAVGTGQVGELSETMAAGISKRTRRHRPVSVPALPGQRQAQGPRWGPDPRPGPE